MNNKFFTALKSIDYFKKLVYFILTLMFYDKYIICCNFYDTNELYYKNIHWSEICTT